MTDTEMLALLRENPEKGLRALIAAYGGLVAKTVRGRLRIVCTAEDIEETVSDVFLELYGYRDRLDPAAPGLPAFLMTLAQRRAVDRFRQQLRRKEELSPTVIYARIASPPAEETALKKEERELRLSAGLAWGEPEASILFRRFYYGETFREIGKALSLSENAAAKRYHKALKTLKTKLKGDMEQYG